MKVSKGRILWNEKGRSGDLLSGSAQNIQENAPVENTGSWKRQGKDRSEPFISRRKSGGTYYRVLCKEVNNVPHDIFVGILLILFVALGKSEGNSIKTVG